MTPVRAMVVGALGLAGLIGLLVLDPLGRPAADGGTAARPPGCSSCDARHQSRIRTAAILSERKE